LLRCAQALQCAIIAVFFPADPGDNSRTRRTAGPFEHGLFARSGKLQQMMGDLI
jgi:hypothetical protein